jgi:cation transport ATPase
MVGRDVPTTEDRAMSRLAVTALVAIHLVATIWHGNAHTELDVTLSFAQTVFVYVVILIAPLVAAALVWTRHQTIGLWLFFLSMLGAFLFGAYHHYVLVSPDNIAHLPDGPAAAHAQFIESAAVIALLELGAAIYGAFCLGASRE